MKKLRKFLGYAFCLTSVLTAFSSCLSDDNDDDITITEPEAKMIFDAAKGTYEGDLYQSISNMAQSIAQKTLFRMSRSPSGSTPSYASTVFPTAFIHACSIQTTP